MATKATGLELHGEVIAPGDAQYDDARALFNAWFDKRPALIARCADVDDVVKAVGFARAEGLDTAIRCGAHNAAGLGSVEGGLVIDLSGLRSIRVDSDAKVAHIGGGCLFRDVD